MYHNDRRVKDHVPSEALGRRLASLPDFALIRVLVNELNCNIHVQPVTLPKSDHQQRWPQRRHLLER